MVFDWLRQFRGQKTATYRKRSRRLGRAHLRLEPLEERVCMSAPTITVNPSNLTVDASHLATFTAAATGTPTPTVQWEISTDHGVSFHNIPGATFRTLSFVAVAGENGDEYEAVFKNSFGSATTTAATLTVDFAPIVTVQPASRTVAVGTAVSFTAQANANPAATVQWQILTSLGFKDIAGATSTTLNVTAPATHSTVAYRAVFTNTFFDGTPHKTATHMAFLTADIPTQVTLDPASKTVDAGRLVTFTANATGTPTPTVQWQVSTDGGTTFHNIVGAVFRTLNFLATPGENGNEYRAVFTNPVQKQTTTAATLTVDFAPIITLQPASQTVATGSTLTLTANANSNPSFDKVQWFVSTNGGMTYSLIAGATSPTLMDTMPSTPGIRLYYAVFSNTFADTTQHSTRTHIALVRVDIPAAVTLDPASKTVDAGHLVTFTANASGTPTPTVQWQVSTDGGTTFHNIAGAVFRTLNFVAAPGENGDEYRAQFTNPLNTVDTTAATLTVDFAPIITRQPTSEIVAKGSTTAQLMAGANANPGATVQWQVLGTHGFTNFAGATSTTFNVPTTSTGTFEYRAVFTNALGSTITHVAVVTVVVPPSVTVQPVSQTVAAGQRVTFTARATGTPNPTVQWQVSTDGGKTFHNMPGATSTTISWIAILSENGFKYRAVFSNGLSTDSNVATLVVT
jgi:hypothetical protein